MNPPAKPSLRVAAVCVLGRPASTPKQNQPRGQLLAQIVTGIHERGWAALDALLLPGGFFRLNRPVGHLAGSRRLTSLQAQACLSAARRQLDRLQDRSAGCLLVTGMLADPSDTRQRQEQLSVALSAERVVGLARKLFPTAAEGEGRRQTVPCAEDYGSTDRLVTLPCGAKAILSACYDLFGLTETPGGASSRYHAIRALRTGQKILRMGDQGFKQLRRQCLADWSNLLTKEKPHVAIATIHGFERPGLDGFWQRHGIAAASAAMQGRFVVGAAHFEDWLPAPGQSTLASVGVSRKHLTAGTARKAHRLAPKDTIQIEKDAEVIALVRLFEAPMKPAAPSKAKAAAP
ncbi:hypothetical protein [Ferrovibrio sp.]|uniref:hypothetical protein n=1 Tax=Ferrovibrio sp. TaxID=1917215 RepID=UPI0035B37338